jgi:hypothetical protein
MTADEPLFQLATIDTPAAPRQPDFLIDDGRWLGDGTSIRGIVLPTQNEQRARGLLEMAVPIVFLGEAALVDGELPARLASEYGRGRIGVYLPVRRQQVSWALETQSNADFRTFSPSHCEPAWEVLRADGSPTGTLATWWLGVMLESSASSAVIQVDIADDVDLNLCAGLMELHAQRLWFAPLTAGVNRYAEWLQWGKVRQLAVPVADFDHHPDIAALLDPVPGVAAIA